MTREESLLSCIKVMYKGINRAAFSGSLPEPAPLIITGNRRGIAYNSLRDMIEVDPGELRGLDNEDIVSALHVAGYELYCRRNSITGSRQQEEAARYKLCYLPGVLAASDLGADEITGALIRR